MMFPISLTPEQVGLARTIGFGRFEFNHKHQKRSRRIDPNRSDLEISVLGAYAEVAVSVAEGVHINCTIATLDDFRRQIRVPDVGVLEVKYTTVKPPRLAVREEDRCKSWPAKFVLVAGTPPDLVIVGFIEPDELFQPENLKTLKHCRSYVAPFLWPYTPPERRHHGGSLR